MTRKAGKMINHVAIPMIISSGLFFNFVFHVWIKQSDFFRETLTSSESVYATQNMNTKQVPSLLVIVYDLFAQTTELLSSEMELSIRRVCRLRTEKKRLEMNCRSSSILAMRKQMRKLRRGGYHRSTGRSIHHARTWEISCYPFPKGRRSWRGKTCFLHLRY
jgi:hypothetical protein